MEQSRQQQGQGNETAYMYLEQLDGKGDILGTADLAAGVHAQLGVTNI
jgi:hypothetical protein